MLGAAGPLVFGQWVMSGVNDVAGRVGNHLLTVVVVVIDAAVDVVPLADVAMEVTAAPDLLVRLLETEPLLLEVEALVRGNSAAIINFDEAVWTPARRKGTRVGGWVECGTVLGASDGHRRVVPPAQSPTRARSRGSAGFKGTSDLCTPGKPATPRGSPSACADPTRGQCATAATNPLPLG